ncbi:glycoside hydrolase family 13 protein [Haloplasma contractile]|uniref:Glycosidase Carbohydrate transport protein n=1 Tax=Haloplasma contractile SSD-17B TaxID=1033810 RepID=U2DXS5_9MOLU|nr:alpha-glucosidase [Haloplasma contractile]ERJ13057.1 Glycosidase Carbohydrate transport protein [Haloplasma contractile SSD-17B]
MERKWWMEAIGYQIYPKSFNDTNGDGIGDIKGVTEKLDYLNNLGINMVWLCPFYKSPMDDNGYDVSDYYDVDPMFGNLDELKELISEAHKRGIKIVADLVLNHTSDEHEWFVEARKSKDNKYRDYYIWADGRIDEKGNEIEPTNWASFFGGSCWKKDEQTGQYFMKIFSNKMPDLNWKNEALRKEMYKMANWWLDLGIDGFRVDAVAHLSKSEFVDSEMKANPYACDWGKFSNLPKAHDYLQEFYKEVLKDRDVMTVGEVGGGATCMDALKYSGYDQNEFNMVFNFDHNWSHNEDGTTNVKNLKEIFNKWQTGTFGKGWNPLYWLNHDHPRVLSHYGNTGEYRNESAKMLATALYFMWGTPFIYNGEEIGMTNYPFETLEDFNDVAIKNQYEYAKKEGLSEREYVKKVKNGSRDNARTPMQWSNKLNAGFTDGEPWFHVNPNYKTVNVESQLKDPNSILNYYKQVTHLRRHGDYKNIIVYGSYRLIDRKNKFVYSYIREYNKKKLLVITNFTDKLVKVSYKYQMVKKVLSNYNNAKIEDLRNHILRPYEALVLEIK